MAGFTVDMTELTGEERAVVAEVRDAQEQGRVISDACARAIGRWWYSGGDVDADGFLATGEVHADHAAYLWGELGGDEYASQPDWMRAALDCLAAYLDHRVASVRPGPVPGWSDMWVGGDNGKPGDTDVVSTGNVPRAEYHPHYRRNTVSRGAW